MIYSSKIWPINEQQVNQNSSEHNHMDIGVYYERKKEKCRVQRDAVIGISQFGG